MLLELTRQCSAFSNHQVAAQISKETCLEAVSIYLSLNKLSEHFVAFTFTYTVLKQGELSDISSTSFKLSLQGSELPAESLEYCTARRIEMKSNANTHKNKIK